MNTDIPDNPAPEQVEPSLDEFLPLAAAVSAACKGYDIRIVMLALGSVASATAAQMADGDEEQARSFVPILVNQIHDTLVIDCDAVRQTGEPAL